MILVLLLTIVIALLTRPGREAVINTRRLVRIVPVLDGTRSLALLAIPILAALVIVDYQSLDARTLDPSRRAASASPGKVSPTSPSQQSLGLPNTGADVTTTAEAAFTSFEAAAAQTACRNSTDPVCGPFQWDPVPARTRRSKSPSPTALAHRGPVKR